MTNPEIQKYFYAIRYGKCPGVYDTWEECLDQIKEHDGALFKKFLTREEALAFLDDFSDLLESLVKLGLKDDNPPPTYVHQGSAKVYLHGACTGKGTPHGRGGYGVYWGEDSTRNASVRLVGAYQSPPRAEISAVNYCLKQSQNDTELLTIVINSSYVRNSLTTWYKTWISNGWKKTDGQPVRNKDLLELALELIQSRKGKVVFVNGDRPEFSKGIEEAKILAKYAIE